MDYPYRLPGTTGPDIVIRSGALSPGVLVDGVRIKGRGIFRRTFSIPLADGTIRELRLIDGPGGLRVSADGVATTLGPGVTGEGSTWVDFALVLLPIGVVVNGGLIGGAIGGLAMGVNLAISRTGKRRALKRAACIGVTALAAVLWLGVGVGLRAATTPSVPAHVLAIASGTCLNGIAPGRTLTLELLKPVDCATAHDNEVVGGAAIALGSSYPGQASLEAAAATICLDSFRTYVGIDFSDSALGMIPLLPTQEMWSRGDHETSCVVMNRDGTDLVGSVLGTSR